MLGLTVGIHEAGHFYAAISRGIHVTKFSIGFGPTLLKWQVRGWVGGWVVRVVGEAEVVDSRSKRDASMP